MCVRYPVQVAAEPRQNQAVQAGAARRGEALARYGARAVRRQVMALGGRCERQNKDMARDGEAAEAR